ncbi:MAG: hypothetical protein ABNH53_13230 [Henriciella sp.]|jgi:hypothetical protein
MRTVILAIFSLVYCMPSVSAQNWDSIDLDKHRTLLTLYVVAAKDQYKALKDVCTDINGCLEADSAALDEFSKDFASAQFRDTLDQELVLITLEEKRRMIAALMCNLEDYNACVRYGVSLKGTLDEMYKKT